MMKIDRTNKREMSLLLFLEDRAVNYGGRVNIRFMNTEDLQKAQEWNDSGFIRFGLIVHQDDQSDTGSATEKGANWVELSDNAWSEAGLLRMERGKRVWANRKFQTTEEKRTSENLDTRLRSAYISIFGGIGALNPVLYSAALRTVAANTGCAFDEEFLQKIHAIEKTLPCPLN